MEPIYHHTVLIKLDTIEVEPGPIKTMDIEHYYKLKTSLKCYGQLRNVLIDENWIVIEGRKIIAIMKELGYKTAEAKQIVGENYIQRLNLNSEYSTFDFVKVSVQLAQAFDLNRKDWLKDVLPFKNDDIDDYIEAIDFSMDRYNSHKRGSQGSLF